MSAKIKAIARIVWHHNSVWDWDEMTPEEIAERETITADMIRGVDYDGLAHYPPIACAASRAWDAAIEFANGEAEQ